MRCRRICGGIAGSHATLQRQVLVTNAQRDYHPGVRTTHAETVVVVMRKDSEEVASAQLRKRDPRIPSFSLNRPPQPDFK